MTGVGRARKPRSPKIPSTRLWHSLNVPLPRALPGRSLAELGSLVPSKLPQGSLEPRDSALPGRSLAELGVFVPSNLPQGKLEPRDSAPSERGLQHGQRPVGFAALFTTKVSARPAVEVIVEGCLEEGRAADRATSMLELPLGGG